MFEGNSDTIHTHVNKLNHIAKAVRIVPTNDQSMAEPEVALRVEFYMCPPCHSTSSPTTTESSTTTSTTTPSTTESSTTTSTTTPSTTESSTTTSTTTPSTTESSTTTSTTTPSTTESSTPQCKYYNCFELKYILFMNIL